MGLGLMTTPFTIPLWPADHTQAAPDLFLEVHLPARERGPVPAVVIHPGGGYARRAPHEGSPVAAFFAERGIAGIVAHYRVAPHRFPAPMADSARALRLVRSRSQEWNLARIGVLGFSAGGHLACATAGRPDLHRDPLDDLASTQSARPDFLIAAYPVVTFLPPFAHEGSVSNLLGPEPALEYRELLSHERHVTPDHPPAFLFHTAEDQAVPVENVLQLAGSLRKAAVPFALHVFPLGRHGLGLAAGMPGADAWPALAASWIHSLS